MGKWTLDYHDDVLRDKFKSMVNGAIQRSKLEKGEPTISYETFVTELDTGDSFTSSLIDVLVKELATRRTRPNSSDRHLISERTAKFLRMQGARSNIYRERRFAAHPRSFESIPPLADIDWSDEEEDTSEQTEVYHANTALNEALSRSGESRFYGATEPLLSPPGTEDPIAERVTSPLPVIIPPPPQWIPRASLTHQGSVRMSNHRIRTVDFNEFTSRRRSVLRSNSHTSPSDALRSEDSTDGTWRFAPERRLPSSSSGVMPGYQQYIPLVALTDAQYHIDTDTASGLGEERLPFPSRAYNLSSSAHPTSASGSQLSVSSVPPRLRRGGLRAPEGLRQAHVAPEDTLSLTMETTTAPDTPPAGENSIDPAAHSFQDAAEPLEAGLTQGGSNQLLTPRSNSPSEESDV
ncbi:hypothetical protein BC835DRAFT_1381182 [Cytidiella melzeri]|nr:hypothetical protein BC835DRAFT_1381182 [Cytidiella melzeri]